MAANASAAAAPSVLRLGRARWRRALRDRAAKGKSCMSPLQGLGDPRARHRRQAPADEHAAALPNPPLPDPQNAGARFGCLPPARPPGALLECLAMDAPVTALLNDAGRGDAAAAERVFELLYRELQGMARARLARAPRVTAADTGALVHECWLRMHSLGEQHFANRHHFLAYAARAMRSIVTDMARRHAAERRGGQVEHLTLDTSAGSAVADAPEDLVALDAALEELARMDARAARVVEMRFFAGLGEAEAAEALAVSLRTVQRDWERARAFLTLALKH
ncbi:MAG: sigma-70 family RNA polymerase sigma factor [Rubrivivax sp.]|nr:MAG: sigma-70 family RNA polymerase sigma factor [Rubrivivax sp.]